MNLPDTADDALQPLHPAYEKLLRWRWAIRSLICVAVLLFVEGVTPVLGGALSVPGAILAGFLIWLLPPRQYRRWAYRRGDDMLRVTHGLLFHTDVTVPFGRVQHIDVSQGPLERGQGLGTLTLYTAGVHAAAVQLPGLLHADAVALREAIRARIQRDTA